MTQGERVKAIRTEKKMTMEQFGENWACKNPPFLRLKRENVV